MIYDYIIIGGGLAGTILADYLTDKADVLLIDSTAGAHGSKVAAGIYNPVTGRRMAKSWMVDVLAPTALNFYRSKEKELGTTFLDILNMKRLFHNEGQRAEWLRKVDFHQLNDIIVGEIKPEALIDKYFSEFGGVETTTSWRLDTASFLDAMHQRFESKQLLHKAVVDYARIAVENELIRVGEYVASGVIFCEGWEMIQNPWFNYIPLRPNKGELITIKAEGLDQRDLIQKKLFVLPLGDNTYKVGATYDHEDHTYTPTDSSRTWLIERLDNIIRMPYQILKHEVGIRPASIDRRPFVGVHPQLSGVYIFNGFGSKGVSQMPWCAEKMASFLLHEEVLPPDISIQRFGDYLTQ